MRGEIRELLHEIKSGLADTYGGRLKSVCLYGSYARGQEDIESDVDVLIVLDQVDEYAGEVKRTSLLISRLSLQYGVSVSRVFVSERDWLTGSTPFLLRAREEAVGV